MSCSNGSRNRGEGVIRKFMLRMEDNNLSKKLHDEFIKMINKEDYSFKTFHVFTNRQATFKNWPKGHPLSSDKLAQAGFCYLGFGDTCICAWCSTLLDRMSCFDEPFAKHRELARNSCKFINYIFPPLPLLNHSERELTFSSSNLLISDQSRDISF